MGRRAIALVLVALVVAVACSDASENAGDEVWAAEAEAVVALLADAYDRADAYQSARFYTAGGTLDFTVWDRGVATAPDEVVDAVRGLWFTRPGWTVVRADHTFVSPDSALVWWSAYDEGGGSEWVQTYFFGSGGQTASIAFSPDVGTADDRERVARYVQAWQRRDAGELATIYSPDTVVLNQTTGEEWRNASDVLGALGDGPPVEPGPAPGSFFYRSGSVVEAIVLLQLGGDCPMLEARRLVYYGEAIAKETRFTHIPSAQRCLTNLPDGWWTTFVLPPDLQDNVTEILDVGGSLVELVNAEPIHEEFSRWLFDRYLQAGIGLPDVAAVWFPPAPECDERGGLAIESDARYEGRHTIVVCFTDDRLEYDRSESGWFPTAASYGLHELAHIWMVDRLNDDVRAAYLEMTGLSVWRGAEAEWADRGVEQAAFTIPWGITDRSDVVWPIYFPEASCEDLADRYRLLTDHDPVTPCDPEGTP